MVEAPLEHRAIVFDNQACVFWYLNPNPKASYKVDVVYVDNGGRVQRSEANGHEIHGRMELPVKRPRRFVFDVPQAAYADGKKLELKFIRVAGANAIVSYVRIWSTDPTLLAAPSLEQRAAYRPPAAPPARQSKPLWTVENPVEMDWIVQDDLVCRPREDGWEEPAAVVRSRVVSAVEKHHKRGLAIAADMRGLGVDDLQAEFDSLADAARRGDAVTADGLFTPEAWKSVYLDVRRAVRRLAMAHPQLRDNAGLLFVRR